MKRIGKLIIICCLLFVVVGCKNIFEVEPEPEKVYLTGKHYVEMSIKNYGKLELELDADKAPITVTNFMELVNSGAYNGNKIHRVAKDFVIQGGQLADAKTIKGEFLANGFNNRLSHTRGVVSMARKGSNPETSATLNSASSQFFIVQKDSTYLDGKYAAFGKVISGIEIVDKIAAVTTDSNDKPEEDIVINTIRFKEGE